jgi:hypothetical protein
MGYLQLSVIRFFRPDRIKILQIQTEKFEPHKITLREYFTLSEK